MRRFLYFLPGLPGINPAILRERGLWSRFSGPGDRPIEHGVAQVDGGCIVAAGPWAITPATEWLKGERFSVAAETLTPGPGDLEREVGLDGPMLALADGAEWRVPLLRRWDSERQVLAATLPQAMRAVPGGGVTFETRPEYREVDALAGEVFEAFLAGATMPLDKVLGWAATALAANYRLGVEEVGLMGLFDAPLAVAVLREALDVASLDAYAAHVGGQGVVYREPVVEPESE
jgi:hypothetical protein